MWPFKKKRQLMVTDVVANTFSDVIKISIERYTLVLDRLVVIHDNGGDLKKIMGEIWIFHIILLDHLWAHIEFPEPLSRRIIPMLVVSYAEIDSQLYVKRSHYYGEKMRLAEGKELIIASSAFAELIDREDFGYKESNGKKLLTGVFSQLSLETWKQFAEITIELQTEYEIVL